MRLLIKEYRLLVILLIYGVFLAVVATKQSPVWDEVAHIPAGISHWKFGTFDLYRVNPPLPRMVATLPILPFAKTDWDSFDADPMKRTDFDVGRDFVNVNDENALSCFIYARWMAIVFALIGAASCFCWASELFNRNAGYFALGIWIVSPNVIAWSTVVMPDVPASGFGILTVYLFWRWVKTPKLRRAYFCGMALGLALLSKLTWITLFGILPLLFIANQFCCWRNGITDSEDSVPARPRFVHQILQLIFLLTVGLVILNLGYGFEKSCRPIGQILFRSKVLKGETEEKLGNRFSETILENIPAPFPENYLLGIDFIKWEYERKYRSYFRGEWKEGGWWYYYLYGLLVKVPIGIQLIFLLAVCQFVFVSKRDWLDYRDLCFLLGPGLLVFYLVSSQTGFNHHLRYALPAFPFFFVWSSRIFKRSQTEPSSKPDAGKLSKLQRFAIAAFVGAAISSGSALPNYISFFNGWVGSQNGHKHLLHSNVDFGQGLLALKRWQDEELNGQKIYFDYSVPIVEPEIFGIPHEKVKSYDPEKPGWYAFSAQTLFKRENYAELRQRSPEFVLANSIFIYKLPRQKNQDEEPRTK